uniref:Putative serine/threonine protein kinase n=1 Tax=Xenopsylla cheopis TaxID=163159 RepID=A0A6M2DNM6_XENCH
MSMSKPDAPRAPALQPVAVVSRTPRPDALGAGERSTPAVPVGSPGSSADGTQPNASALAQVGACSLSSPLILAEKFLVLETLEGSTLRRCINLDTQQEMVCKVVPRSCGSALLGVHFLLQELDHVSHPREVVLGPGKAYLLFDKAQGGDLHSHVRARRRLREPEARRLFRQMATAVRDCHKLGVVLRDLKLRKFVFADEQRTKLRLESLEDAVVLENPHLDCLRDKRGCPAYVAPEILRAHRDYSGRAADMWSLGVILYTMLVGRYPFNDSEHASLFAKITRGVFVIPDCLSAKARCLVRSLLQRSPCDRLSAEDVLHHPWLINEERQEFQVRNNTDQQVPDYDPFDYCIDPDGMEVDC